MNKTGIKQLALAVIVQAIKDLHLPDIKDGAGARTNYKHRQTAHYFFQSNAAKFYAKLLGINVMNEIYEKFKNKHLDFSLVSGKKKKYHRRKKKRIWILSREEINNLKEI